MRIYLIGYMGSGKSTVSKRLARKLDLAHYDLDTLFENRYRVTISRFFERYDEKLFRKLESQLLKETAAISNAVIATGGGTPCFYDNMEWMGRNGITVYLELNVKSLENRLIESKKKRPLLADKSVDEFRDHIRSQLRKRNIFYSQAHLIVKGESIKIDQLANLIKSFSRPD